MEYGSAVSESFDYAKDALWAKWTRWILFIISSIIFPLMMGYTVRVLRGEKPAPELKDWGTMFVDGLKYFAIGLIYAIPLFIVVILSFMPMVSVIAAESPMLAQSGQVAPYMSAAMTNAIATMMIGIVVILILGIIIAIFELMGLVRFARMNSMKEAFNFSAILEHIGKIGWGTYILALIVYFFLSLIYGCIIAVLQMVVPVLGWIVLIVTIPLWIIFVARYLVHVYECAIPATPAPVI
ncbi:MAG: DUF4013 domain-containing protein [Methanoregulaceae archaeon]